MRVYTFQADSPVLIPETDWDSPGGPRIAYSDQPVDFVNLRGHWKCGDKIVMVSRPDRAGVEYVCMTEGSPGTWIEAANSANGVANDGYVSYGNGMWPNRYVGNVASVSGSAGNYYISIKRQYAELAEMGIHITTYQSGGGIPLVGVASGGPSYGWDVKFFNPSTGVIATPEAWFALLLKITTPSLVPGILPV